MAALMDELMTALSQYKGGWKEKKGLWEYSAVIAERKAFLSKKSLTYSLRLRIDEPAKTLHFSEMLAETGSGFSSGGDFDSISTGFGVKTESYNTFGGVRKGTIEEQSRLFGKDYSYQFNYIEVRSKVQDAAAKSGYRLDYQILPVK